MRHASINWDQPRFSTRWSDCRPSQPAVSFRLIDWWKFNLKTKVGGKQCQVDFKARALLTFKVFQRLDKKYNNSMSFTKSTSIICEIGSKSRNRHSSSTPITKSRFRRRGTFFFFLAEENGLISRWICPRADWVMASFLVTEMKRRLGVSVATDLVSAPDKLSYSKPLFF